MHIKNQDKASVTIELSAADAQHLLSGLTAPNVVLGTLATTLRDELVRAGVTPLDKPDHIRSEHVPPSDLMNPHSETGD